jgi:hypothetical protein
VREQTEEEAGSHRGLSLLMASTWVPSLLVLAFAPAGCGLRLAINKLELALEPSSCFLRCFG